MRQLLAIALLCVLVQQAFAQRTPDYDYVGNPKTYLVQVPSAPETQPVASNMNPTHQQWFEQMLDEAVNRDGARLVLCIGLSSQEQTDFRNQCLQNGWSFYAFNKGVWYRNQYGQSVEYPNAGAFVYRSNGFSWVPEGKGRLPTRARARVVPTYTYTPQTFTPSFAQPFQSYFGGGFGAGAACAGGS